MVDNRYSLTSRLLKYFSTFAIIPIIILSIALGSYSLSNTISKLKQDAKEELKEVSNDFDYLMQDANQIADAIAKNLLVIEMLKKRFISQRQRFSSEVELNSKLAHLFAYFNDDFEYYIIGENLGIYTGIDKEFLDIDFHDQEWYIKSKKQLITEWYLPHVDSFITRTNSNNYMTLVRPIVSSYDTFLGVIVVDVKIDDILAREDQFFIIDNEQISAFDDGAWMNYHNDDSLPEIADRSIADVDYWNIPIDKSEIFNFETTREITVYKFSQISKWVYTSVQIKNQFYKVLTIIILLLLVIIIGMALLAYFVSYKVSKSLTTPLVELLETMAIVQSGDFSARVKNDSKDEIGLLSKSFNSMVLDINQLMRKIYEEQEMIKKYELMLLQAQINPHFLYNTLDSIIWLIRMKQEDNSIKMIHALTAFLRSGLSKGKDIINLGLKIENASSYLTIQQLRYKNKLSYEIDFPDSMLTQPIPKLTLQPLIENALYHGIKNNPDGGFIHIYGYTMGDDTVIVVSDDGMGMDESQLKVLSNEAPTIEKTGSFGINNVRNRLRIFFNDKCSMQIQSKPLEGTKVVIKISGKV